MDAMNQAILMAALVAMFSCPGCSSQQYYMLEIQNNSSRSIRQVKVSNLGELGDFMTGEGYLRPSQATGIAGYRRPLGSQREIHVSWTEEDGNQYTATCDIVASLKQGLNPSAGRYTISVGDDRTVAVAAEPNVFPPVHADNSESIGSRPSADFYHLALRNESELKLKDLDVTMVREGGEPLRFSSGIFAAGRTRVIHSTSRRPALIELTDATIEFTDPQDKRCRLEWHRTGADEERTVPPDRTQWFLIRGPNELAIE